MSVSLCTQCGTLSQPSLRYTDELESSSLLHNLRTSNFPTTDQEASHIQHNILPNIDAEISSISTKISSLQDVITTLQQEIDALATIRNTYRGLISPCRAVPRELWEQVFLYVHEDDHIGNDEFTVSDPNRSIWEMAKVCQTWRAVAMSLHSCWTKLRLDFPEDGKSERNVRALEVALQRSGQHPLDITLLSGNAAYNPPDFDPSFRNQMLAMVHAESHRWRNACLMEYQMDSDILYAPLRGRIPMLESLNLYLSGDLHVDNPMERQTVLTVFSDCPRLTKAVLTGTKLLELPWIQIRELCLDDMCGVWVEEACRHLVSLVGRCSNLQVLRACDFIVEEYSSPPITIRPSIRILDTAIDFVMDQFNLPHLEEAILTRDLNNDHTGSLRAFHRLLHRSKCSGNLTSLTIRNIPLHRAAHNAHRLHKILSQMTHLAVLDIRVSMKHLNRDEADHQAMAQIKEVLDALIINPDKPITFLPCLTSLDIDLDHHMYRGLPYFGRSGRFVAMLKARWEGDDMRGLAKLKRFQFSLSALMQYLGWPLYRHDYASGAERERVFGDDEGRILRDLVMDGMDVAIKIQSVSATRTITRKVVRKFPGEPSQQEAEDQLLLRDSATY